MNDMQQSLLNADIVERTVHSSMTIDPRDSTPEENKSLQSSSLNKVSLVGFRTDPSATQGQFKDGIAKKYKSSAIKASIQQQRNDKKASSPPSTLLVTNTLG